jgi:uncharacterized protein YeaO (DUF488 family)
MRLFDRRRYRLALARRKATLTQLRRRTHKGTLRLVYSAPDIDEHNDAVTAAGALRRRRRATRRSARP